MRSRSLMSGVFVVLLLANASIARDDATLRPKLASFLQEHCFDCHSGDNPEADLSIEALADYSHMSVRNFARRFREETGVTPGKYVERIRLAAARSRLENSAQSIESVAQSAGFINSERMRRTFMRHLRISPQDYRRRFQL